MRTVLFPMLPVYIREGIDFAQTRIVLSAMAPNLHTWTNVDRIAAIDGTRGIVVEYVGETGGLLPSLRSIPFVPQNEISGARFIFLYSAQGGKLLAYWDAGAAFDIGVGDNFSIVITGETASLVFLRQLNHPGKSGVAVAQRPPYGAGLGIDRYTGTWVSGFTHVQNSIACIFSTHFGTRVLRRWVGSAVPVVLGRNLTPRLVLKLFTAMYAALAFEPRFSLIRVEITSTAEEIRSGVLLVTLEGEYYPLGHLGNYRSEGTREVIVSLYDMLSGSET
jgi:uncharacterized protein